MCLSVCLSVCLFVCLLACLFASLFVCLFVCLSCGVKTNSATKPQNSATSPQSNSSSSKTQTQDLDQNPTTLNHKLSTRSFNYTDNELPGPGTYSAPQSAEPTSTSYSKKGYGKPYCTHTIIHPFLACFDDLKSRNNGP
jgi:hypothetical protein